MLTYLKEGELPHVVPDIHQGPAALNSALQGSPQCPCAEEARGAVP